MIMRKSKLYIIIYVLTLIMSIPFLLACSSTSALKEGQQLFTGLKPIEYSNYEKSGYADTTMLEMENVLASAPNGALFGSSYYRTPFPVRLWIWNAFSQSEGGVAKWITRAFGAGEPEAHPGAVHVRCPPGRPLHLRQQHRGPCAVR